MAVITSRRVRGPGRGGLVQQPAALGAHRQHPAGRSRGTLLRHAGTTCHGGVTQTKWPPTTPERFSVTGGERTGGDLGGPRETDCVGHVRFELANPSASYLIGF